MTFPAWYAIAVGLGMVLQWLFFLVSGQVPEVQTEPLRIAFHLVGEAATAVTLIVGGIALCMHRPRGRDITLIGNGMLIYTVTVSPGYFAQSGDWPMVALFAALLVLALVSVLQLVRHRTPIASDPGAIGVLTK